MIVLKLFTHSLKFPLVVVESLSCVQLFATPWTTECQDSLSFTISQTLLKFMSIEGLIPSNHLIFCHPLLFLSSIFSSIRVFSNKSAFCITCPKYWSFSISPSSEYSGLISFKIDCLMIQQSHCWAYTLRKPKRKETRVPQCSSQHCL